MQFDKGQRVDEMHGHEPSSSHGSLKAFGYKPVAIIEIDDDQAQLIATASGVSALRMKRDGKFAYVVASNEEQVVVIYFYDSSFFLTTLTTDTPEG